MVSAAERGNKPSAGKTGRAEKASPAPIEKYLKGIDFPSDKENLVKQAKENKAPEDILHILNQFEDKEYESAIDISKEVGRIE